jgi:predicted transcriptional regulator
MPKNPFAARLSDETIRRIDQLAQVLEISKTLVVETAIRNLARIHKIK